jgi:hypothetical protein
MGSVFSAKVQIETPNDQKRFKQLYSELHTLFDRLLSSPDKNVKKFISDPLEEDDVWLWNNKEKKILGCLAERPVSICSSSADGNDKKVLTYDFGKQYPAPVEFIGAVMFIMAHAFKEKPKAVKIYAEGDLFGGGFFQGIHLARVINKDINIPPIEDEDDLSVPEIDEEMSLVVEGLKL